MEWSDLAKLNLHRSRCRFIPQSWMHWRNGEKSAATTNRTIGFLQAGVTAAESRYGVRQSCANTFAPSHRMLESRNDSDGILSGTRTRLCCGASGLEPAASAVTGQRSNQLNYVPSRGINDLA